MLKALMNDSILLIFVSLFYLVHPSGSGSQEKKIYKVSDYLQHYNTYQIDYKEMLSNHEGNKTEYYRDQFNNLQVGIGHLAKVGNEIPQEAVDLIFDADLEKHAKDADDVLKKYSITLDPVRRAAIINICFQCGSGNLSGMVTLLNALKAKDWKKAKQAYLNTKTARIYSGEVRRNEIANMLLTGKSKYMKATNESDS